MDTGSVARRVKLGGLLALPATAALLAFASIAFACTPQATLTLTPPSGPVGTAITVNGKSFTAGSNVKVFWGGIHGTLVATAVARTSTIQVTFTVPAGSPNGATIVSANQVNAAGEALGSPANVVFTVNTPGGATAPQTPNVQDSSAAPADPAAALAPLDTPAAAPVVRVAPKAPARSVTRAPAPAASPTPATVTPPAAAPTPAAAPAAPAQVEATQPQPQPAPAPAPARKATVSPAASHDSGSSALPIVLVGLVVLAALGATAAVLASRRDRKATAKARH